MEAFFIGLFSVIIGVLFIFSGFQFFRPLIPVWALFAGLLWSAQEVTVGLGTGFLTTVLSWVVGILVGVIFAILAYVFYEIAIGVLVGFLSYWLVSSILIMSGVNGGIDVNLISSLFGIILGTGAFYIGLPRNILILLTALAGATAAVAGFMVMFGQLPLSVLGSGIISAIIFYSFGFTVLWSGLILLGVIAQVRISAMMNVHDTGYSTSFTYSGVKGGKSTKRNRKTRNSSS